MFDAKQIQKDFPILNRPINGKRLVYLDNAATTQKPQAMIDALKVYYANTNANIHRGIHTLSEEATSQYEGVRKKVGRFHRRPFHREHHLYPERNGSDQPGGLELGP